MHLHHVVEPLQGDGTGNRLRLLDVVVGAVVVKEKQPQKSPKLPKALATPTRPAEDAERSDAPVWTLLLMARMRASASRGA